MILFQPEHVQPILDDIKIKTRRLGSCRWKVNSIHKAKTVMISRDYFALLRILTIYQEPLGSMTEKDALEEGGYTLEGYKKEWEKINGLNSWNPDLVVWVVQFERVFNKKKICEHCWQFNLPVSCSSEKCCVNLFFEGDEERYATPKEIIQFCCRERCHHGIDYHDHSCSIKLAGVCKEHMWKHGTNLPEKDASGLIVKRITDYV